MGGEARTFCNWPLEASSSSQRGLQHAWSALSQWPLRSANKQDAHGGRQRRTAGERTVGQWAGGAAQVERANARVPSEQRGRGRAEQERCLARIACPLRDLNVVSAARFERRQPLLCAARGRRVWCRLQTNAAFHCAACRDRDTNPADFCKKKIRVQNLQGKKKDFSCGEYRVDRTSQV